MDIFQKMDPAAKAAWLEALRSGVYEQTTGTLVMGDPNSRAEITDNTSAHLYEPPGFCCLGVLYDVMESAKAWDGDYMNGYAVFIPGDEEEGTEPKWCDNELPEEILSKYQLHDDAQQMLIKLNDGGKDSLDEDIRPHSFLEIADWIERNL